MFKFRPDEVAAGGHDAVDGLNVIVASFFDRVYELRTLRSLDWTCE